MVRNWYHKLIVNYYYNKLPIVPETQFPLTHEDKLYVLEFYPILQLHKNSLVVYDIGSAKGQVAECMAKIQNISKIEAFEPIKPQFRALQEVAKGYQPKIQCHNIALGDSTRESTMSVIDGSPDCSTLLEFDDVVMKENIFHRDLPDIETETVQMCRLDDYVKEHGLERPDIIKMDVEGYELHVIAGGGNTIKQAKGCIIEVAYKKLQKGRPLFHDIHCQMDKLGFQFIGTGHLGFGYTAERVAANALYIKSSQ